MVVERIFYVTASELTVLHCACGKVSSLARFELGDDGVAEFSDYINQDPDHPSAVMVDVIEEEFKIENAPHVTGGDRHRLLDRKAATLFRGLDFRSFQVIGRESGGRRDDQILFSAINKPEVLDSWIKAMQKARVPLTGVYSVSMLGTLLINKLKIKDDNTLLLTIQGGRLLRQSFFSNGKPKLSRLTPLASTDADSFVVGIVNEVDKMRRYLGRLQLLNFKKPMEVYFVSGGDQLERLKLGCFNDSNLNYHFIELNNIISGVKLKQPPEADECEKYFASLLSRELPDTNYIRPDASRYYLQYRIRRWVGAPSIALALPSALWSISDIHTAQALSLKAERIAMESEKMQREYEDEKARMPLVDYAPRTMRATVEANQRLVEHEPASLDALVVIGASLAKHRNIELDQIRWGPAQQGEVIDENGVSEDEGKTSGSASIKAHLRSFPDDYQAAFKQVDALAETLKQNPGISEVTVVQLPLNIDPESLMVGETRYRDETPVARFELAIKLKGGVDEV